MNNNASRRYKKFVPELEKNFLTSNEYSSEVRIDGKLAGKNLYESENIFAC